MLFLGALIVLGSGITVIQIAANPYVTILGPEETAPSRLNLSQGLNSLGYVITPLVGGVLLFGSKNLYTSAGGVDAVKVPYVGLGIAFILLAVIFKLISLPNFRQEGKVEAGVKVFRHKHFFWGWLAIFFYVGSEVTVGSILINYLNDPSVMGMPEETSAKYLAFYWGGTMIGRLMGAISLSGIQQYRKYLFMVLATAQRRKAKVRAARIERHNNSGFGSEIRQAFTLAVLCLSADHHWAVLIDFAALPVGSSARAP